MVAAQGALEALFAIRLAFPITLLISSISLLTIKPTLTSTSPSPINSVVVAVTTPRRSLILSLLSLVALTYFLDGFALVLHSVLTKTWQGIPQHGPWIAQWSGLEVEVIAGLLASGLLAILGVWKESQGITIWTMSSPKLWAALAVIGTIVEVTLIAATVVITGKRALILKPFICPFISFLSDGILQNPLAFRSTLDTGQTFQHFYTLFSRFSDSSY